MTEANTNRYLAITRAQHALGELAEPARNLNHDVNDRKVWDADEDSQPLYAALVEHRNAAGAAAIGESAPIEPDEWTRPYADAIMHRLTSVINNAEHIAAGARSVRDALAAGLITDPRPWSADDVTGGAMLAYIDDTFATTCEGDAAQAWGCIESLTRHKLAESITEAVYDHHMRRLAELWSLPGMIARNPKHEADLTDDALAAWREAVAAADNALAEPLPYLHASHAIAAADTFDRLAHYAAALCGPTWSETTETTDTYDNARQTADRLMIRLARCCNDMGPTDTAGVDVADAAELVERITEWRLRTLDDAVTFANTLDTVEYDNDDELTAVLDDAYERLYLAAGIATSASELVEVWHAADVLTVYDADRVRISAALRFDADGPGRLGVRFAVDGDHAGAARELRRLIDGADMPSNAIEAVNYRGHTATVDELDMRATMSDVELIRAWDAVVADADAGAITRRQLAALRELVNAKIAEWCDGSEARAAGLAARLPEWERIGDELTT